MEFALIVPVVLLLLVAAVDVGRLFSAYVTIEDAAKEGALFGANQPSCTSKAYCDDPNNTTWHVVQDLSGLSPAAITVSCNGARLPTDGSTPTTSCLSGQPYQVAVTYPFTFYTPLVGSIIGPSLSLGASASAVVLHSAATTSVPALSVYKSSATTLITAVGQQVSYDYLIANTGNVALGEITAVDSKIGTVCTVASLAVGATAPCTATYTTTSTDVASQRAAVTNTVIVTATSPSNVAPATATLIIPIQTTPSCTNPTVSFTASQTSGSDGLTPTFSGTVTVGTGQTPQSGGWTWDDGTTDTAVFTPTSSDTIFAVSATHTYTHTGNGQNAQYFTPSLTVTTGATCSTTYKAPNHYITLSP